MSDPRVHQLQAALRSASASGGLYLQLSVLAEQIRTMDDAIGIARALHYTNPQAYQILARAIAALHGYGGAAQLRSSDE